MNYTDEKCICCDQNFIAGDDVVVCPECGTPHHRACYKENGSCINAALHETGESWKRTPQPEPVFDAEIVEDLNGGAERIVLNVDEFEKENDAKEQGMQFEIDLDSKTLGFDPEEDCNGVRLEEVADFVKSNRIYYISTFKRMKDFGKIITFNVLCFFFPHLFFANRKMWFSAVIATIFIFVLGLPGRCLELVSELGKENLTDAYFPFFPFINMQTIASFFDMNVIDYIKTNEAKIDKLAEIFKILTYAVSAFMCLFANRWYYNHSVKSIKKAKRLTDNPEMLSERLSAIGGTSIGGVAITAVVCYIALPLLFAAFFIIK